jgi:hypothetical protein
MAQADPIRKTAIFTLKNPHNFPATKFPLKAEKTATALHYHSSYGPTF